MFFVVIGIIIVVVVVTAYFTDEKNVFFIRYSNVFLRVDNPSNVRFFFCFFFFVWIYLIFLIFDVFVFVDDLFSLLLLFFSQRPF